MVIDKVLNARWQGLAVTLRVSDEKAVESDLTVSPQARAVLLLELLDCAPDHPEASKITLATIGTGTNIAVKQDGHLI